MKNRYSLTVLTAVYVVGTILLFQPVGNAQNEHKLGYDDTPFLPGGRWRVHDSKRPQPRKIQAGSCSTQDTSGLPPSDALVLFDGKDLSKWRNKKGGPADWKVQDGYMEVVPWSGDIYTHEEFGDIQLHVEWRTPSPLKPDNQWQGNSGVFLYGNYEVQVFESSLNLIYADGQAGALYGQYPPLVNPARQPGEWQVFDIIFTAPRFKDGKLETPAYFTVLQNGVVIHNHVAGLGDTRNGAVAQYVDHGPKGPIRLQDHGDLVRYRNIWVRPLKGYDEP